MNPDTLEYLSTVSVHMAALFSMVESKTVRMRDGREEFFKWVPGNVETEEKGAFASVTRPEVKAAIDRFLKAHEKPGLEAAKQFQKELQAAHADANTPRGFGRKSRETHAGLVFRTQIRYLMDHVDGPRFDLNKALLVDLPETFKTACAELSRFA